MKKIISLITIITITVATLTYALWDINFAELGQLLSGGDYRVLIPFLAILALFYWMKAVRWVLILRPVGEFTRKQVTPSLVIGFAANNVLPAHLGELIRIALFARQYKKPVSSITISLLVERIFDLVAILSFYALSIALIDTPPESLEIGAWLVVMLLAGILVSIAIVLYRPDLLHRLADRIGHLLPGETGSHLTHMLDNIINAFSSLKSPILVLYMTAWSMLKWGLMVAMIWLSLMAYGTAVSPGIAMILMAVLALAAAVPNAPGYVGAIQAAYVFALRPFGIAEEIAFAASVFFLACQWIPVTAAGAYYFIKGGLHVDEVRREMEEVEEDISDDRQTPVDR
ncbi:MAG: flippase-like domain-containing protein [Gammaproteobacteria bacterium]|nr:flippase-like domain-containing protein [Gammaproteobacteria bacterium]